MPNIQVPCKVISLFGKTEKPVDSPNPELILTGGDWLLTNA